MLAQESNPASQAGETQASSAFGARTAYWTNVGAGLIAFAHKGAATEASGGAA